MSRLEIEEIRVVIEIERTSTIDTMGSGVGGFAVGWWLGRLLWHSRVSARAHSLDEVETGYINESALKVLQAKGEV